MHTTWPCVCHVVAVYAMLSHPSAAFSPSVSIVIRDQEPQDGGNDHAISASLPSRRPSRQDTSMVGAYSSLANATQSVLDIMPWTLAATLSVRTCRILTRTSTTLSATWTGSQRDGAERGENLQLMPESTCKSAAWMSCRTVTAKEGVKGVNGPENCKWNSRRIKQTPCEQSRQLDWIQS